MRHVLIAAVLSAAVGGAARADVLLHTGVIEGMGTVGPLGGAPEGRVFLAYADPTVQDVGLLGYSTIGFLQVAQGDVLTLPGDYAGFNALGGNGVDNALFAGFLVAGGTGTVIQTSEQTFLSGSALVGLPDFSGYEVTAVRVQGTSYQLLNPGQFTMSVEYSIYGNAIPAPGVAGLAGLGGLAMARRRR